MLSKKTNKKSTQESNFQVLKYHSNTTKPIRNIQGSMVRYMKTMIYLWLKSQMRKDSLSLNTIKVTILGESVKIVTLTTS